MGDQAQVGGLVLRFGVFEADLAARELRKRGVRVKLQDQPFRVLEALLERPGEVVTREQLRERLWAKDEFVEFDASLNTAIQRIRQALGDSAENPRFIETIPRVGYRLIAHVAPPVTEEEQASETNGEQGDGSRWLKTLPWALAAALAAVLLFQRFQPTGNPTPERATRQFTITPELHGAPAYSRASWAGHRPAAAISPDGSKVAYVSAEEVRRIWIHDLTTGESRPPEGADVGTTVTRYGAPTLSWSPDSESLAYLTARTVKKISMKDGGISTLHSLGASDAMYQGSAWNPDGDALVVSAGTGGGSQLLAVPSTGGEALPLEQRPDLRGTEPTLLPGPRPALVCRRLDSLYLLEISTGEDSLLLSDAVNPSWSPTGHILFDREGSVWALPFSLDELGPDGEPFLVQRGFANGGVTADGTLLAVTSRVYEDRAQLTIRNNRGELVRRFGPPLLGSGGPYGARHPAVSPDGRSVAVSASLQPDVENDIWVFDIQSGRSTRLTANETVDDNPIWTRDGRSILFRRNRAGERYGDADLYLVSASGGEPELLLDDELRLAEPAFSPAGDVLMIQQRPLDARQFDLHYMPFPPESEASERVAWRATDLNETHAQFSPDGKYVAYSSSENLRGVHIRPFEDGAPVWHVSGAPANAPRWGPDGRTLYSWSHAPGHPIMAADIDFTKSNPIGPARRIVDTGRNAGTFYYDVMPDGWLIILEPFEEEGAEPEPTRFLVIQKWFEKFRGGDDAK